jgi:hypothetical protein
MSVVEKKEIDGIGKSKDGSTLVFMIADHLEWDDEFWHLNILQDKINSYLEYIETNQFSDIYPNDEFKFYHIEISFKYKITDKCKKFLETVQKQIENYNIKVIVE